MRVTKTHLYFEVFTCTSLNFFRLLLLAGKKLMYLPGLILCLNFSFVSEILYQRARNQSIESQKITSQDKYSRLGKVIKTSDKMDVSNYGAQIT